MFRLLWVIASKGNTMKNKYFWATARGTIYLFVIVFISVIVLQCRLKCRENEIYNLLRLYARDILRNEGMNKVTCEYFAKSNVCRVFILQMPECNERLLLVEDDRGLVYCVDRAGVGRVFDSYSRCLNDIHPVSVRCVYVLSTTTTENHTHW